MMTFESPYNIPSYKGNRQYPYMGVHHYSHIGIKTASNKQERTTLNNYNHKQLKSIEHSRTQVRQNGNFIMKYKQDIGLIPNVSYGDFVLGSNINTYLSQEHTKKMYDEVTFSNISYFFKREEINVWCDTDGSINTIICSSYCLFHNKNLIGMKYTDFLTEFSKGPDSEDNIYVLVSGKGQRQHVYDFEKDGLQVWVWRNRIRTVLIYNANL